MNLFSNPKCPKCNRTVSRDDRFCPACGEPLGGAGVRCGVCGAENQAGSEYCSSCGRKMAESQAPEFNRHRWSRRDEEFAVRVEANDLPGWLKSGVIIEPGANAMLIVRGANQGLLPPGEYTISTIGERIHDWLTGNIPERAAILLVDTVPTGLEYNLGGRFTKDPLPIGMTLRLLLEVADPVQFLINMLHGRERLTKEEVRQYLYPEVVQIADRWLRQQSLEDLVNDPGQRARLELALEEELRPTMKHTGLRLLQVRTVELNLEPYDELKGVRGKYALVNARAAAELDGKKLTAASDAERLKFEEEQKLLLARIQFEASQKWSALNQEKNLQELAEETAQVELEERKIELYQRMRQAVQSDKMNEVRSEADFKKFMRDIEGEQLLQERERQELLRTWQDQSQNLQRARAHLLARLDVEQDFELRMLRLKLQRAHDAEKHAGDMEALRAEDELWVAENIIARKRADWDFEMRQRTALETMVLEQKKDEIARAKEKNDAELARLIDMQKYADLIEKGRLGIELTRIMEANDRLDEEERLRIEREDELTRARELQRLVLEKMEFGERQRAAERAHELERIKLFGTLGSEALISLSAPEQAKILADLKHTEALQGMSEEQILAMAAEKSPQVAQALVEKYRSIAQGQASEVQKEMYERLLSEQKETLKQLREMSEKHAEEERKAWESSAKTTQEIATHAMDRIADVAKNQGGHTVVFSPGANPQVIYDSKQGASAAPAPDASAAGEAKVCPSCGRFVAEQVKYCNHCGHEFKGV